MQLQQFLFKKVPVRGPLGLFQEERVFPAGTTSMSIDGISIKADANGWLDVPYEKALELKKHVAHREDGGYVRFCTPEEVDQNLRLGLMEPSISGPVALPVPAGLTQSAPPPAAAPPAEPAAAPKTPGRQSRADKKAAEADVVPESASSPAADDGGRPGDDDLDSEDDDAETDDDTEA